MSRFPLRRTLFAASFLVALAPVGSPHLAANPAPLDFSGGNGTGQVDQWQGNASSGWNQWGISAAGGGSMTATATAANPLFDGGGNYLSSTITNTRGMARRTYSDSASFNTAEPHSIIFSHRLDSFSAGFDDGGRRVVIFASDANNVTTGSPNSWVVAVNSAGNWTVQDGNKSGGLTTIDTGLAATLGTTYTIAVHVDPASKEYAVTITDTLNPANTTSHSGLGYRTGTAAPTVANAVHFGHDSNGATGGINGNSSQFSLDAIRVGKSWNNTATGAASGSWDWAANWQQSSAAQAGDTLLVDNGGEIAIRSSGGIPAGSNAEGAHLFLGVTPNGSGAIHWERDTPRGLELSGTLTVGDLGSGQVRMTDNFTGLSASVADTTYIGRFGPAIGEIIQDTGSFSTGNLIVGDGGTGTYTLDGGQVTANALRMGLSGNASGTFNVLSGTLQTTVNTPTIIGGANDAQGFLNVEGGTITLGGQLHIGASGNASGTVTQSGGDVTTSVIQMAGLGAAGQDTGTTASYTIADGTLTVAQFLQVGRLGTGEFTQTGGTVNVNRSGSPDPALMIGGTGTGTYTLEGGQLIVPNLRTVVGQDGEGTFTINGGTALLHSLQAGLRGTASGTVNVLSGTLQTTTSNPTIIGVANNAQGFLNIEGGTVALAGELQIGGSGNASGAVTQSGGGVTATAIQMAHTGSDAHASYSISDGTLTVAQFLQVGRQGTGEFTQSGGTVNVNRSGANGLIIGGQVNSTGIYELSGGTLNVPTSSVAIGEQAQGNGTFNQSGGIASFGNNLVIGGGTNNTGAFNQSGGTTTVDNRTTVGDASGNNNELNLSGTASFTTGELMVGQLAAGNGTLTIADDAVLTTTTTGTNIRIGNAGTGAVIQTGGSFLAAPGSASYIAHDVGSSGSYQISGGTLDHGSLSIGGGSGAAAGGTGLLTQSGGEVIARRDIRLGRGAGTGTYEISGGTLTVLAQNGDGRIILGHDNSGIGIFNQSGGTVSTQGGLRIGNGGSTTATYNLSGGTLLTNAINSGAGTNTFNLSGGTLRPLDGDATFSTPITLTGSGATFLTDDAADTPRTITVTAAIGESGGSHGFSVDGSGRLVLNTANSYTGGTTILGGTVVTPNNSSLGTGPITFAGDGAIETAGTNRTLANPVHIDPGVTATAITFPNQWIRFNGDFTGSGTFQTGDTPGQWTVQLGGDNSAFTGTIHSRDNATIRLQTAGSSPANGTLQLSGSGIVNLNQNAADLTYHVGTLIGESGTVVRGFDHNVVRTLSVGEGVFAGQIQNGAGTVALEKVGPGTLTLTGGNTFSGGTTMHDGTIVLGTNSALGSGPITFAGDSALAPTGAGRTLANPIHIDPGVTATALTNNGEILRFNGNLTGSGTIQTGTTAGQWTVQFGGNNSAFTGTIHSRDNATIRLQTAGSSPANGTLQLSGSGIVNLNQNAANLTYHVGTLIGESGTIVRGFDHSVARTLSVGEGDFAGLIQNGSGTVGLEVTGPGTLVLTGNNTYTGPTNVLGGTLQIGDGTTTGTLGGNSNTSIAAGATLRIQRTDQFGYQYSGALSGSGTVHIPSGANRFDLTSAQTNSGDLAFVIDGTLGIRPGGGAIEVQLGELSGSGTIQRGGNPDGTATLLIGGKNTDSTFAGTIASPEIGVDKVGDGTLTLTGANTYGGGTTVSAGTLLVNNTSGSGTGSGPVAVDDGGTLGGTGIIGGATVIAAGGTLSPGNSAGTLTFNNNLTLDPGATMFSDVLFGGSATDLVVVGGNVSLGGAILDGSWGGGSGNIFSGTYSSDNMFWLIDNQGQGPIDGRFANTAPAPGFAGLFGGVEPHLVTIDDQLFAAFYESQFGVFSQAGLTGGNDLLLMSIPEPSRALLVALALGGLLLRRRRS